MSSLPLPQEADESLMMVNGGGGGGGGGAAAGGGEAAPLLLRGGADGGDGGKNNRRRNGLFAAVGVTLVLAAFVVASTTSPSSSSLLGDGAVVVVEEEDAVEEGGERASEQQPQLQQPQQPQRRRRRQGDSSNGGGGGVGTRKSPLSRSRHHHFTEGMLGKPLDDVSSTFGTTEHDLSSPGPFVSMEGMFEYEKWDKLSFEENQGGVGSLHQMLDNYGASVPWDTIRSTVNTGLGAKGRRKLFFLVRHAEAMHNEWGRSQKHVRKPETIPCDYKSMGDLVDPELTEKGKSDVHVYVHDVFKSGLAKQIGSKVRIFSSPLSRCMRTSVIGFQNDTGLDIAGGRVTVSELLRERIDPRVPFETRSPVSFTPMSGLMAGEALALGMVDATADEGDGTASSDESGSESESEIGAAETHSEGGENRASADDDVEVEGGYVDDVVGDDKNETDEAGLTGDLGFNTTNENDCFIPSKGLDTGHPGNCCVRVGLTQKFGDFFNINVTAGFNESNGCELLEVAKVGWDKCKGPEMLGMLAEDDTELESDLDPKEEESEGAVVQRLRAWFAAVFDEVDENVIIAVTHSDWINHAMTDLRIHKHWFVPRNNEILPVIVEDTRPSPHAVPVAKISKKEAQMELEVAAAKKKTKKTTKEDTSAHVTGSGGDEASSSSVVLDSSSRDVQK